MWCGVSSAFGCCVGSVRHSICPFGVRNWPRAAVRCATGPARPARQRSAVQRGAVCGWPARLPLASAVQCGAVRCSPARCGVRGQFGIRMLCGVSSASDSAVRGAQLTPIDPARLRARCGVSFASGCWAGSVPHPICPFEVRNWPRAAVRCATGPAQQRVAQFRGAQQRGARLTPIDPARLRILGGVRSASGSCAGSVRHPIRLCGMRNWPRSAAQCATGPARLSSGAQQRDAQSTPLTPLDQLPPTARH
ncbi:hypothetical protein SRABI44_00409 [Microbacterium foliorum]|nr:hypothetical protein SRABI44_00409 [Microbacterium foliorum]CAH0221962.1 hypothetical protein SRABI03_02491 [Microbacterium foliorum]